MDGAKKKHTHKGIKQATRQNKTNESQPVPRISVNGFRDKNLNELGYIFGNRHLSLMSQWQILG